MSENRGMRLPSDFGLDIKIHTVKTADSKQKQGRLNRRDPKQKTTLAIQESNQTSRRYGLPFVNDNIRRKFKHCSTPFSPRVTLKRDLLK